MNSKKKIKRYLVKTHIITEKDNLDGIIRIYVLPFAGKGDIVVFSESIVAILQGRAIPEKNIKIGLLAKFLWSKVRKVPYGVGLRSPATMQCAINEAGAFRILMAAIIGGITRFFGRRGDFYRIAGKDAAMIDAAHTSPVPPFDQYVVMGPKNPQDVVNKLSERYKLKFAIMDINDIGGSWAVGFSEGIDKRCIENLMRDNPMGQGKELTPICIIKDGIYGKDEIKQIS
ncbi:MAG: hypothetical protein GWP03_00795 [Proteobacteria bacterium]|nr:hypothetical protein [Pseudomonadota bacterium]